MTDTEREKFYAEIPPLLHNFPHQYIFKREMMAAQNKAAADGNERSPSPTPNIPRSASHATSRNRSDPSTIPNSAPSAAPSASAIASDRNDEDEALANYIPPPSPPSKQHRPPIPPPSISPPAPVPGPASFPAPLAPPQPKGNHFSSPTRSLMAHIAPFHDLSTPPPPSSPPLSKSSTRSQPSASQVLCASVWCDLSLAVCVCDLQSAEVQQVMNPSKRAEGDEEMDGGLNRMPSQFKVSLGLKVRE